VLYSDGQDRVKFSMAAYIGCVRITNIVKSSHNVNLQFFDNIVIDNNVAWRAGTTTLYPQSLTKNLASELVVLVWLGV
jgi:hypothetical protein